MTQQVALKVCVTLVSSYSLNLTLVCCSLVYQMNDDLVVDRSGFFCNDFQNMFLLNRAGTNLAVQDKNGSFISTLSMQLYVVIREMCYCQGHYI